jgi:hypothetical protein
MGFGVFSDGIISAVEIGPPICRFCEHTYVHEALRVVHLYGTTVKPNS